MNVIRLPPSHLRTIPTFLVPFLTQVQPQRRHLHQRVPQPAVPEPTPFIPDVSTFLTCIGRNLSVHAAKIPSWEALFSLTSPQLKELGIEPPRNRRYLLRWRQQFREGRYGIGGDAKVVVDGAVPLRVVDVPVKAVDGAEAGKGYTSATHTKGMRKVIVNAAVDQEINLNELVTIGGVKLHGLHTIVGPHVIPAKGGEGGKAAKIVVKEGIWEDKRGRKIDGGERRRAEVRAKRRSEEKKTTRG